MPLLPDLARFRTPHSEFRNSKAHFLRPQICLIPNSALGAMSKNREDLVAAVYDRRKNKACAKTEIIIHTL